MNRHRSKKRQQTIHVWTYQQARQALPYLTSILRSLREHLIEARSHERVAERLARKPGRPDRADLIAQDEAKHCGERARARFQEVLHELFVLDLYCLDPLGGLSLIPILYDGKLAWLVLDLFDADPLRYWRFHKDSLDTRRPVSEIMDGEAENRVTV